MKNNEHLHQELSDRILGASMAVLNELKPGLDEKLYEKALIEELRYLEIDTNQQMQFPVNYRGKKSGC